MNVRFIYCYQKKCQNCIYLKIPINLHLYLLIIDHKLHIGHRLDELMIHSGVAPALVKKRKKTKTVYKRKMQCLHLKSEANVEVILHPMPSNSTG